jgi:hypothetical protein
MKKQDLRDWSMKNIEQFLNQYFVNRKMTKKMREKVVGDISLIVSNAYRIGYYAHAIDTENKPLTTNNFDNEEKQFFLHDILGLIREIGK